MRHKGRINSAEFSPDGTRIVSVFDDYKVRVWDAGTGIPLSYPMPHNFLVSSAKFSPDGMYIVTASFEGTRVWHADTGVELAVLAGHAAKVGHAAWNRAGTRVVTASDDGTARVWDVEGRERFADRVRRLVGRDLVEAACLRLERNMTRQEWRRFMRDTPYRETCPGKPGPELPSGP